MIEIQKLSKYYQETAVVEEVSLTVAKGELLVLLGGSGSGKTTLLKMINRLIEPSKGNIRIDGKDIQKTSGVLLRRQIGYVFQKIGLFPHLSIAENIMITPSLLGWKKERMLSRVDELLSLLELDPKQFRDRNPSALSGGQQQRIGVARALAAKPKLMLLDEPFGALDPLTRDRLQASFIKIRRSLDLTAIFVTHDMVEALLLGDRIAVMNQGKLVQIGSPQELLLSPKDEYVAQLMSTPKRQAQIVQNLLKEPGA